MWKWIIFAYGAVMYLAWEIMNMPQRVVRWWSKYMGNKGVNWYMRTFDAARIEWLFLAMWMLLQSVLELTLPGNSNFGLRVITATFRIPVEVIFTVMAINMWFLTTSQPPRRMWYGFGFTFFYTVMLIYAMTVGELSILATTAVLYLLRGNFSATLHIQEKYQREQLAIKQTRLLLTEEANEDEIQKLKQIASALRETVRDVKGLKQEIETLKREKQALNLEIQRMSDVR